MALFRKKNKNRSFSEASPAINKNSYKKLLVKATSLLSGAGGGRENLISPEFDLSEIKKACEADSYIKVSLMKYSYMLFKAGYVFKSDNENASNYIKQRFNIMSFATSKPFDILLQECGDDLIKYSNSILVKSRVQQIMPGIKATGFFKDKPVGGYFRVDPSTIQVERDSNGTIKKYVQSVDGEEKTFDAVDVIHLYLDREADNTFGTPRIIAALEDVKLLRRIEGNIVSMIYRFSMPLFQWIIGLPQQGFQATNKEIDEAKKEVDNMALDGTVITNEKTQIKVVGAEGSALNAEGYLKYFEQRVFSALGVSESQMGRGGAKQDADSMESQAHDTVKHIQRTMSIFLQELMINEILLEGGFNPLINDEDKVQFVFNEINIETKIKVENHEMAKYQSNVITFEEIRRTLGKKEDVDADNMYKNFIEVEADKKMTNNKVDGAIRLAQEQAKHAKDLAAQNAKIQTANSTVPGSNGTNKSNSPNKDVSGKDNPQNQHGKTSVKVKEASSNVIKNKKKHKEAYESMYRKYYDLCENIINDKNSIDLLLPLALENISSEIKIYMGISSLDGLNAAVNEINKTSKERVVLPRVKMSLTLMEDEVRKSLKKTLKDIEKKIKNEEDSNVIKAIFESMEYRLRFLIEFILPKTYWYSYLKTGKELNYEKAIVDFNGSEDEKSHSKNIDLNNINIDDIPPYHPFCDCTIKFKKGDK